MKSIKSTFLNTYGTESDSGTSIKSSSTSGEVSPTLAAI